MFLIIRNFKILIFLKVRKREYNELARNQGEDFVIIKQYSHTPLINHFCLFFTFQDLNICRCKICYRSMTELNMDPPIGFQFTYLRVRMLPWISPTALTKAHLGSNFH